MKKQPIQARGMARAEGGVGPKCCTAHPPGRGLPDDDLLLHLLHFQIALHCGLAAVIVAQANTTKVVSLIELEKYVFFFWKNI